MFEEPKPYTHQDLKVTATIVRNMDIEPLNVDPNPCGYQTSQQKKEFMDTSITRITTQDKAVIIAKSMDMSLRIVLGHTLEATAKDG